MARHPRIHYPGAIYHVIVKGNNGEAIFFDDLCKNKYLSLLVRYKRELGFILFAFCIMTNHAHLLIAVQEVPLSQIMQRVQLVFTQWFNRTFNRTGHVFQQRYKALLCDSEIYFFELIRYIHNNPVKENLPGGLKYQWSSYGYYIGIKRGNLVDITETLEKFSKDRTEALRHYLHFMDQELYPGGRENSEGIDMGADPRKSTNLESPGENVSIGNETGSPGGGFSRRASGDGNGTNKGEVDFKNPLTVDEVIEMVCSSENVEIGELRKKNRAQIMSDIRKTIVLLCFSYTKANNKQLAEKLNLDPSTISKIKSDYRKRSEYVDRVIERWKTAIKCGTG